jgi:hypothetical protein
VLAAVVAGCSSDASDASDEGSSDLSQAGSKRFDVNRLVEDSDLRGGAGVTVDQVQAFLTSKRSFLATFQEGGVSAAQIIVDAAHADQISPVYLLARIQGESSLVENPTSRNVAHATGCACPDGQACAKSQSGFKNQVVCAADLMNSYFNQLEGPAHVTVSANKIGKASKTFDPCTVTPANNATAALYTYTPWVGAFGRQCSSNHAGGGSSGIALLITTYKDAFPGADAAPPASSSDDVAATTER